MKSNIKMISMIAALVIGLVGAISVLSIFLAEEEGAAVEMAIYVTIGILVLGVIAALASSLRGMVVNPVGMKNALIGVGALGLIVVISLGLADGSDYANYKNTTEETAYYVSAGMNAFYITGLLAVLSVLYSAVARIIK
ncbi:MAG: hypothetical protein EP346_12895 [Bacteroidetes bacterium]|uniref:Uncharacterized protein n=1 Tax=Phaeocystidibacter marisrubri TaxID=1577780 RepID=A0A6L3ZC54_9FLAO|nr:hypothetical protein [Phaeocystidibacter marisrubri]KAB2815222.1 hypothetical protein F8C82_14095 [Phaeocystidibacter marisrubri]TNE27249.1 MAG: hypothetical protein EP346_12895 [Bacteroidota bacterium]GGH70959.1 hypothetical protein GCM10011318_13500 [Phaeocystidibacter marisrubri]